MNVLKKYSPFKILVWCLIFSHAASYCYAQPIGRISYTEGRVDILRAGESAAVPAVEGESVSEGDSLRTKSDSKAEITFNDDSAVHMAQNTRVTVSTYKLREDNKREDATITLDRGKLRAIIAHMDDNAPFNVDTQNAHGTVKGSEIFAFFQAGNTGMLVSSGNLSVINPTLPTLEPIIVTPGNSILIPEAGEVNGPRPYLDLEKSFHEKDTSAPAEVVRKREATVLEGTVTKISGEVTVTPKGQDDARALQINDMVRTGDRITTGTDGMVEIKFDNGNAVNLKPDTDLVIVKLITDPKTRTYENEFEVSRGQLKAVVENIKGGSSFQVKTPHAISGVRGTIQYVNVQEKVTEVFFEGGPGFITSLTTGKTKEVGMGEKASADEDGNLSDPMKLDGQERMSFVEGWTPGSGIEGYSAPDGVTQQQNLYDPVTGVNNIGEQGEEGGTGGSEPPGQELPGDQVGGIPPVDVPITEGDPDVLGGGSGSGSGSGSGGGQSGGSSGGSGGGTGGGSGGSGTPGTLPPITDGPFGASLEFIEEIDGQVVFSGGFMTGNFGIQQTNISLSGDYNATNGANPSAGGLFWGPVSGIGADGSSYLGNVTGIKGSLLSLFFALYIRPVANGFNAGYFYSTDITGDFNAELLTFDAGGTVATGLEFPTIWTPEDLFYGSDAVDGATNVFVQVSGDYGIQGGLSLTASQIEDQDWGILWGLAGGTYDTLPEGPWTARVGGQAYDPFNINEIDAYLWGELNGSAFVNNEFAAHIAGTYLDNESVGDFSVDLLGRYTTSDSAWSAFEQGTFSRQIPLTSSGDFFSSAFNGLMGLTDSPSDGTTHIISIGQSFEGEEGFVWYADQFSGNQFESLGAFFSNTHDANETPLQLTTFPDEEGRVGAFFGFSGGAGVAGALNGEGFAIFLNDLGGAGIASAPLAGEYNDVSYILEGDVTLEALSAEGLDISPEELVSSLSISEVLGSAGLGAFDGQRASLIRSFFTSGVEANISGEDWGVGNFYFFGDFDPSTSATWHVLAMTGLQSDPSTAFNIMPEVFTEPIVLTGDPANVGGAWLGGIRGTQWSNNELAGELSAAWVKVMDDGRLTGERMVSNVYGAYTDVNELNVWEAASTGDWVEVDDLLTLSGLSDDITALGTPNVPITEVYSSLLTGQGAFGAGGSLQVLNMIMNFYTNGPALSDGIWAANLSGTYQGSTSSNFDVNVSGNLINNVTGQQLGQLTGHLIGTEWANGNWQASVNGEDIQTGLGLSGVAAGTFGDGTWSGSGAGAYDQ